MSYSRRELERQHEEDMFWKRQRKCKDKYYEGKSSQYYKCSHGFFSNFRNEEDIKNCEKEVYKAYEKCLEGRR